MLDAWYFEFISGIYVFLFFWLKYTGLCFFSQFNFHTTFSTSMKTSVKVESKSSDSFADKVRFTRL